MPVKLYYAPAYCSLAVHIALRETGLPFDLLKVDTVAGRIEDGRDWRSLNPRGYVPMLELDDGSRHTEVAALLQFVGEQAPGSGLLPVTPRERFEVQQWLTFVSSELHKVFSPWLFHKETADSTRQACKDKIALRLAELDRRLASRQWLMGDAFTVVDAYAFAIVNWTPMLGMPLSAHPNLAAWFERVRARPNVRAALEAEGLLRG